MPRINRIANDTNVELSDKLLGTDSGSTTKNFTIEDISKFFSNTNAAGIAGQLTYEFKTTAPFGSGTAKGTFSTPGSVQFNHLTNLKVSVNTFGTNSSKADILATLSSKKIIISDVIDQNTFGIFNTGTIATAETNADGDVTFVNIPLTLEGSGHNGSLVNERKYAIRELSDAGDLTAVETTTSNQLTITNGTGPIPSLAIVTGAIANAGTGLATADQIHTFVTTQTDTMAASTTGNAATATKIASITNSDIVQLTSSQTLTNKTLTTPTITTPVVNAGIQLKNGATSAGFAEFFEDSDNGTNKVTLIGPASTADVTVTLPASAGTVALTSDIPSSGISSGNVATFTSGVADNDFLRVDGTSVEGRSASEVLSDIGGQASLTFGISNTNAVKIDSASVADDEFARFTANGLESRSASEVRSDIGLGTAATLAVGISNTNVAQFGSGVADNDFLRVDGTTIEGRSASELASDIGAATTADIISLSIALG